MGSELYSLCQNVQLQLETYQGARPAGGTTLN